jgi:hypothetical protein
MELYNYFLNILFQDIQDHCSIVEIYSFQGNHGRQGSQGLVLVCQKYMVVALLLSVCL